MGVEIFKQERYNNNIHRYKSEQEQELVHLSRPYGDDVAF